MDTGYLSSAVFWEDEGCFVAGDLEGGAVGELAGVCGGCVLFQTSGSTGEGRWLVLEKRAMLVSGRAVNGWLDVGVDSVWGLALPLNHVGGFSILGRVYLAGCGLEVFEGRWDAGLFVGWLEGVGVTHVSLVPTQVYDLVRGEFSCPKGVVAVVVGGGCLADEVGQRARDLGWPVLASYGMTECGSQVATQCMGALSLGYDEGVMEVLPIWEVWVSEEGLLGLVGEALFSGEFVRVEGGWFFERRVDGCFLTSDRVELLGGRGLSVLGRADSLVKVMGELVDLEGVEREFFECGGGGVVWGGFAVVNVRDERRENGLVVVFEGESGGGDECFSAYQRGAAGVVRLERWVCVGEFPRTNLGKLRRGRLREMVEELFSGGVEG